MKKFLILSLTIFISVELTAQTYSDSLTIELTKHLNASDLPGFSVAIVNENGVLYQKGFGLANKENRKQFDSSTILNLGSVSKTVVGLALVKAIEDGKLTMDSEIKEPCFHKFEELFI